MKVKKSSSLRRSRNKNFLIASFITLPVIIVLIAIGFSQLVRIVSANFAAWGDSSLINACVNNPGLPTIVNPGSNCNAGQTQATWLKDVDAGIGLAISRSSSGATLAIADKGVTAAKIGSETASSGQVLTADGSGGANWQTSSGGNGPSNLPYIFCNTACSLNNTYAQRLKGKDLSNSIFNGIFFSDSATIDLSNTNFTNVLMTVGSKDGAFFSSAVDFSNDNFTGADLTSASANAPVNFTNVNFTNANLRGSSWNGNATVTGVTWSNTTCPDGTNSDNDSNTCVGHGF